MRMASINVENAEIKTASIEIKALTVNGRQVTMSTFRQLQEEELIDFDNMKLNGIPWGHVNYFWKDNGLEGYHLHIIWQKGKDLKRSSVPLNFKTHNGIVQILSELESQRSHLEYYIKDYHRISNYYFFENNWHNFNINYLNEMLKRLNLLLSNSQHPEVDLDRYSFYDAIPEYHSSSFPGDWELIKGLEELRGKGKSECMEFIKILIGRVQENIDYSLNAYENTEADKLDDLKDLLSLKTSELNKILDSLKDLPQLFIAV